MPQLLNVLIGDMSIVGPRPHALAHDQLYVDRLARYARRHNVKPGITGWAQVRGHRGEIADDSAMLARLEHDLYYVDNWSLWLDIKIMFDDGVLPPRPRQRLLTRRIIHACSARAQSQDAHFSGDNGASDSLPTQPESPHVDFPPRLACGAPSLVFSRAALRRRRRRAARPGDRQADRPGKGPSGRRQSLATTEIVGKANDFLNTTRFMSADFVQIGPDGKRTGGPAGRCNGRARCCSATSRRRRWRSSPTAARSRCATRSSARRTSTSSARRRSNSCFPTISISPRTRKLKRVDIDGRAATVEIEDKATFGGKSDITLVFDPETFELKQWTVIDPQGFRTLVSLFALDLVTKPDPTWFYVDDHVQPNLQRGQRERRGLHCRLT